MIPRCGENLSNPALRLDKYFEKEAGRTINVVALYSGLTLRGVTISAWQMGLVIMWHAVLT